MRKNFFEGKFFVRSEFSCVHSSHNLCTCTQLRGNINWYGTCVRRLKPLSMSSAVLWMCITHMKEGNFLRDKCYQRKQCKDWTNTTRESVNMETWKCC